MTLVVDQKCRRLLLYLSLSSHCQRCFHRAFGINFWHYENFEGDVLTRSMVVLNFRVTISRRTVFKECHMSHLSNFTRLIMSLNK